MAIKKPKQTSNTKWILLGGLTLAADVLQVLADLTGVGIAASEAAEPFIGVTIVGLCQAMKIDVINKPKRIGSLLAAFGLDAVTGGLAPFWILDVIYIAYDTKKEEKVAMAAYKQQIMQEQQQGMEQPLYVNGVRRAQNDTEETDDQRTGRNQNFRPLVVDGVRAPSK